MSKEEIEHIILEGIGIDASQMATLEKIFGILSDKSVKDLKVFKFAYAPIGGKAVLTLHVNTDEQIDTKYKVMEFLRPHGLSPSEAVGNRASFDTENSKVILEFISR